MRQFLHLCALTNILLLYSPHLFTHASDVPAPTVSHVGRSWLINFTTTWIQRVWRLPARQLSGGNETNCHGIETQTPPSTLSARYGGDLVLRFDINTIEEAEAFKEAANVLFLDVWEFTPQWVDVRLSKDIIPSLLGLLPSSLQHAHRPLMHDLAQAILESYPSSSHSSSLLPTQQSRSFSHDLHPAAEKTNIFFREYQPLSVIVPWMRLLRSLYPTHVRMLSIGLSYEGRDIPALRVGVHPTNAEDPAGPRKTIIVTGGSHAREWISTSSVNYVAYSFITSYGRSKSITKLLERFDLVFLPVLNVDGYVYTWERDRLWRKNRQDTALRFCKGLDLDRSFGFEWDNQSSKNTPCSETFSGDSPFEAVESRGFANWIRNETENNNVKVVGFLDIHSYSQQILYPYSYSCISAPPSLENLEELAIGLAKAIRATNGENYGVASACEGTVPVSENKAKKDVNSLHRKEGNNRMGGPEPKQSSKSKADTEKSTWPRMETGGGSALDWFYHEMKVPYAYQIKLRDTGSYGFLLPKQNIVPTGKEAFSAVEHLAKFLTGDKGIEDLPDGHEDSLDAPDSVDRPLKNVDNDDIDMATATKSSENKFESEDGANKDWELRRRRRK